MNNEITDKYSDTTRLQLVNFRDASNHSAPACREAVRGLFDTEAVTMVENLPVFRVCDADDVCFKASHREHKGFASGCATLSGAQALLKRPPNPFADRILKVVITGKVLFMPYADDSASSKKRNEEEILFLIKDIESANRV